MGNSRCHSLQEVAFSAGELPSPWTYSRKWQTWHLCQKLCHQEAFFPKALGYDYAVQAEWPVFPGMENGLSPLRNGFFDIYADRAPGKTSISMQAFGYGDLHYDYVVHALDTSDLLLLLPLLGKIQIRRSLCLIL
jgi:hypothetical protein